MSQSQVQSPAQRALSTQETELQAQEILGNESHLTYREMDDVHVQKVDLLQSIRFNLNQLEDLQGRIHFMMREIHSHIK